MNFIDTLAQLDWIRGVRFWILVATAFAAWEAAFLFRRAVLTLAKKGGDHVR
ncbi:hypothetical protein AWB68_02408 [Caballeronia choica]|uniref:Uncharacterized protein n=1 Tax=Caballeronia choica TaxID=326476 RepID=A0A158HWW7_9BURK|nr:hypothetical protein AWB68_02408 [Caballeronia choica]